MFTKNILFFEFYVTTVNFWFADKFYLSSSKKGLSTSIFFLFKLFLYKPYICIAKSEEKYF